ncbi:MAG: type II toxin-antitoxin system HicA family toxin [Burkholderiales bacterium]|nr:type II toxin-antitoxin system HicA family toxin [Burkholderiales bacterium]
MRRVRRREPVADEVELPCVLLGFSHPTKGGHVSVPHPKKHLGVGLVKAIPKQAGLR